MERNSASAAAGFVLEIVTVHRQLEHSLTHLAQIGGRQALDFFQDLVGCGSHEAKCIAAETARQSDSWHESVRCGHSRQTWASRRPPRHILPHVSDVEPLPGDELWVAGIELTGDVWRHKRF